MELPQNINSIDLQTLLKIPGISLPNIPGGELPKELKLEEVNGIVVNSKTNEPLKGVQIISPLKQITRTNDKGEFKIKVPKILSTPLNPTDFKLEFIKVKYSPLNYIPYASTKDTKFNLGIIALNPQESNLKQEIINLLSFTDQEVEDYTTIDLTFEFYTQKQLNLSITELKKIVIPLIISLLAQYGLSKIQELIEEVEKNNGLLTDKIKSLITCPTGDNLKKIIDNKNKLVSQINKVLQVITKVSKTLETIDGTIKTIDTVFQILKVLPTPTAIGGVGIPISVVNAVQDVKNFLNNNIGKFKQGSSALNNIVRLLVGVLSQVLMFLKFLDLVTQFCIEKTPNQIESQKVISNELNELVKQQTIQGNLKVTNVNGFEMGVETEITEKPLKRRRAIARNKQGVIMLKGEWSFSSIDQILIDELVFYIQINDLKAE